MVRPAIVRAVLVVAQIATVALTWPLYEGARATPLLPVIAALAPLSFGGLTIVSALAILRWPRRALAAHVATLALAMLADRMRIQPAPISLAIMLAATCDAARLDAALLRAHFAALWIAAGVAKFVSGSFADDIAPLVDGAWVAALPWCEVALGVAMLAPRAWRASALAGGVMHATIFVALAGAEWNRGVWAWNAALAVVAPLCVLARANAPRARAGFARAGPPLPPRGRGAPPPAFGVSGAREPTTLVCSSARGCELDGEVRASMRAFGVPPPGDVGTLERAFLASCRAGDRWLARERGGQERVLREVGCPAGDASGAATTTARSWRHR